MMVKIGNIINEINHGEANVFIHGCNCFHTMGSGVARQLADNFPQVLEIDRSTKYGDEKKLGTFSVAVLPNGKCIVNAYTQYGYGRNKRHVDYEAVRNAFGRISEVFDGDEFADPWVFCYPKIGAGLGGGDWETIARIIDHELKGRRHYLIELPSGNSPTD